MNVALQETRKLYWQKVHAIQAERGCSPAEAKRIYKQNGHGGGQTVQAEIHTPDALVSLAHRKAGELETAIGLCQQQMQDLQADLERWTKIARSLDGVETAEAPLVAAGGITE